MTRRNDQDGTLFAAATLGLMWRSPRMVAWFVVSFVAVALPRWVFSPAQALPYCVLFNPGVASIPLCGMVFGPAGVWGATLASLVTDWMIGMTSGVSLFRAVGVFIFAYSAQVLWAGKDHDGWHARLGSFGMAMRFVAAVFPGLFAYAVWVGYGSEWMRLYPFPYVVLIASAQYVVFVPLVGIPLMRFAGERFVAKRGDWSRVMCGENRKLSRVGWVGAVLLWLGTAGALLAGIAVASRVYNLGLTSALNIGVTDCPGVLWAVAPFLVVQLAGVFLVRFRCQDVEMP